MPLFKRYLLKFVNCCFSFFYLLSLHVSLFCASAWVGLMPESQRWDNAAACIGETTALAAKKLGLRSVYFPANPGLEG